LISAGALILLFVAYQLWGTGIAEAHSQHSLKRQFLAAPTPTTEAVTTTIPDATTTTESPLPPPPTGSAVAIIDIPRIHVDAAVVQGVGVSDLQKGPGHYPDTPLPGQAGNAAIAGHRTTYGAPFYRLNELRPGDPIYVTTKDAARPWQYQVMFSDTVSPDDVSVLDPTKDNRLTLTTCTPRFTASQRLVVVARLIGAVDPRPPSIPVPDPAVRAASGLGAADIGSLSGQGESTAPAIAWGVVCAAVWALAWLVGQRWRRWTTYALAAPVFLVCLFFFFQNFARFVPANI
jgi:sortase A